MSARCLTELTAYRPSCVRRVGDSTIARVCERSDTVATGSSQAAQYAA